MADFLQAVVERMWTGIWQGAVLIGLVWIVCRSFKNLGPKVRYWLWWFASLKLLLSFVPQWSITLPMNRALPAPFVDGVQNVSAPTFLSRPPVELLDSAPEQTFPWMQVLVALWAIGVIAGLIMLAFEWLRLKSLLRNGSRLRTEPIAALVRTLALSAGLLKPPQIFRSKDATSPFVAGIGGGWLVLPEGLEGMLTSEELEAALSHELAHIKRHDLILGWVPSLARLIYFFFPPAHIACREWAVEREAACDQDAIALTQTPVASYGDLLIKIVSHDHAPSMSPCLGATASFHTIKRRISLMKTYGSKPSMALRIATPVLLLLTGIALVSWRFAAQDSGNNLLTNPSVEADATGWTQGMAIPGVRYGWIGGMSHSGRGSLSISKNVDKYFPIAQWSQTIAYTSSQKGIKVGAFVTAKNVSKAKVDVSFEDANHKAFAHQWVGNIGQTPTSDAPATYEWKAYSGIAEIPAGTKFITVNLQDYGPGSVWFDDISASYCDIPKKVASNNLVVNPGFE
jgi:beta-lactamase regulating signal transducer with metallopeptidase domain